MREGRVRRPEVGAVEIEDEFDGTRRAAGVADLGEVLEGGGVSGDWEEE